MQISKWKRICMIVMLFSPIAAFGQSAANTGSDAGISGLWVLANISYAGMRAQNHPSIGWRIVSFIFGFPGTLISFLAVRNGGERAYGISLPKKS
jgi:hypothetical protein